jgi:tetratricopeptide (TPR) repeat protein
MKKLLTLIIIFSSLTTFGQTAQDEYAKGNDKANSQDFAGSIKDFDKAIKLDPKYTDAYYNRGTSKMYLKEYKEAIADFDKAIELKPDFLNAFTNRGVAKLELNDLKGSLEDFNAVIKLDATNASAYFMRGQAKLQMQDMDGGCKDLTKAKELGDSRADKYISQYCGNQSAATTETKTTESLMMDWPDAEGWKIADQQDDGEQKVIDLLRNNETLKNWTEIGTMIVYKNLSAAKKVPITSTMDIMYETAKKDCPKAKLTLIEKDESAKYPWVIYKIECPSKDPESQVWFAIQGTDELFVNFRAVKQKTIPPDLQDKWVTFFKTAKIVTK